MARSRRKPSAGGGKKRKKSAAPAELPIPAEMERAFIRDILDYLWEDPRYLILADWLEEQGDPVSRDRAELIRVQCELLQVKEDDPRHKVLSEREEVLLGRLKQTWLAPLEQRGVKVEPRTLSRGLVTRLHVASAEEFCKIDEQLFEAYPSLRALCVLPGIHVQDAPGSRRGFVLLYPTLDARTLVSAPCMPRITELSLTFCNMGAEEMRNLAASPRVRNLSWLVIVDHQSNPGADHMAEDIPLGDEGLAALAESPNMEGLRDLRLWYNRIGPEGVRALAHSAHVRHLTYLTMVNNPIGDEGAAMIANGPALAELEELMLCGNGFGPKGAEALARSPYLSRIRNLVLNGQRFGRRGMDLLRERFGAALHADEESEREPD